MPPKSHRSGPYSVSAPTTATASTRAFRVAAPLHLTKVNKSRQENSADADVQYAQRKKLGEGGQRPGHGARQGPRSGNLRISANRNRETSIHVQHTSSCQRWNGAVYSKLLTSGAVETWMRAWTLHPRLHSACRVSTKIPVPPE